MSYMLCMLAAAITAPALPQPTPVTPPGPHFGLSAEDHADCPTFTSGEPVVGTSYFYWYNIDTGEHILDADGSDALTTHPADMELLSYANPEWHRVQLEDMTDAGLDFLIAVFWGVPGTGKDNWLAWSYKGIPPLVEAWEALESEGKDPPAIGMFFDTSTLAHNALLGPGAHHHVDLTTDWGRFFFYATIRDFYSMVPPRMWARVDGRPVVFLYGANYAAAQDGSEFAEAWWLFERDFGVRPFIVKMRDWKGEADAVYQWRGASPLLIDRHVAGLGPGYDDSNVLGRKPSLLERRDGATYRESWEHVLSMNPETRPWMIHVETWNEWHEGADIAHSRQYGRKYIDMTRHYADLFRAKTRIEPRGPYADAEFALWSPSEPAGIEISESKGDGVYEILVIADAEAAVTRPNGLVGARYLYFDVDPSFLFDAADTEAVLEVTYLDDGCASFQVEYDNTDPDIGLIEGAFRPAPESVSVDDTGAWKTATIRMPGARFAGRCNGSDFRLFPAGGAHELAVSGLKMRAIKSGASK